MAEFVEATERLAGMRPAVSSFGSARARSCRFYASACASPRRAREDALV